MPRPVDPASRYLPGLDGLRAIAVLLVLGYHFGLPRLEGGLLGVSIFFTLSGFLITGILVDSWQDGRWSLRRFYLARARRLLPALTVVLLAVLAVTVLVERDQLTQRWRETVAAAFYVSNWETIRAGDSYFSLVGGPGPLDHLWSLAVEEQFYLIWPALLVVLFRVTGGRLSRMARVTLALAAVSFVLQAVLARGGFDNTRAYEGTDTRVGELLIGAALALFYRPVRIRCTPPLPVRAAVDIAGIGALVGIGWLVTSTSSYALSLYRGGLLGLSLLTAVVLFAVSYPGSLLGRLLGMPALRWVGERSYGIYLWHLPVVVYVLRPGAEGGWIWPGLVGFALTLVLASLSWTLLEDPVRRDGLRSLARHRPRYRHPGARRPVLVGGLIVVMAAVAAFAPVSALTGAADRSTTVGALDPPLPPPAPTATPSAGPTGRPTERTSGPRTAPTRGRTPTTSCAQVVHVGDSTSVGLMSSSYLPDPRDRIDARYRAVGVRAVRTDILGARSIVERYKGQPNAQDATRSRADAGYRGCWVFALGTNEAANVAVGSSVGLDERIDLIMREIGDRPALWLTVRTLRTSGPWSGSRMSTWNAALTAACSRYRTMRVYDWAARVPDDWFVSDGIHFTTTGYRERAKRTAGALATAFPTAGDRPGCLIPG